MSERNEDVILREMDVRNEYVRLSSGHLVQKRNIPVRNDRAPDRISSTRGMGSGSYRGQQNESWSRQHSGTFKGQENPEDERVAQAEMREHKRNRDETSYPNDQINSNKRNDIPIEELLK